MSDKSVIKILFVCYGNTCRSPMAEALFKDLIRTKNVEANFEVDSAGISSWQAGQQPNSYVETILNRNQIPFHHEARQITVEDFKKFDYMFGMDRYNIHELTRYADSLNSDTKVFMLGDFNPDSEKVISDPYFDNRQEDFEKCFVQINASCSVLLEKLLKGEMKN